MYVDLDLDLVSHSRSVYIEEFNASQAAFTNTVLCVVVGSTPSRKRGRVSRQPGSQSSSIFFIRAARAAAGRDHRSLCEPACRHRRASHSCKKEPCLSFAPSFLSGAVGVLGCWGVGVALGSQTNSKPTTNAAMLWYLNARPFHLLHY